MARRERQIYFVRPEDAIGELEPLLGGTRGRFWDLMTTVHTHLAFRWHYTCWCIRRRSAIVLKAISEAFATEE